MDGSSSCLLPVNSSILPQPRAFFSPCCHVLAGSSQTHRCDVLCSGCYYQYSWRHTEIDHLVEDMKIRRQRKMSNFPSQCRKRELFYPHTWKLHTDSSWILLHSCRKENKFQSENKRNSNQESKLCFISPSLHVFQYAAPLLWFPLIISRDSTTATSSEDEERAECLKVWFGTL